LHVRSGVSHLASWPEPKPWGTVRFSAPRAGAAPSTVWSLARLRGWRSLGPANAVGHVMSPCGGAVRKADGGATRDAAGLVSPVHTS
jgi:hypothetical protein